MLQGPTGPPVIPSIRDGLKTVMSLILATAQKKAGLSLIAAIGKNGENFQFQVCVMVITVLMLIPLYPVSRSYMIYSNSETW